MSHFQNLLSTTPTTTFITTKPLNNQQTTILRPIQAKRISPQQTPVTLLAVYQPQQKSPLQNKPPLAPKPPSSENSCSSTSSQKQSENTSQSAVKENIIKSSDKSDVISRVELFGANTNNNQTSTTPIQSEQTVFKVPEAKTDQNLNKKPHLKSNNVNAKNITISLEKKAEEVTNKALKNISKMDIDRLKQIINKPNIEYERVLQNVATKRIRSRMQEKLRNFKLTETSEPVVEPDECIDADKIPDAFLSEIDRVLDLNMFDNTSESDSDVICVNDKEDSDVLDQNLGLSNEPPDRIINPEDIFLRAEILLMGDTSMLEPRSNDCSVASTRNTTPIDDMMTHIDESLYKSEPEIVSIDDDESQDVKNVSGGDKPEINFVNVNEMPSLDIPLPEPNPLPETIPIPVEKQPLKRAPGESPIKFKLLPSKKFEKVSLTVSPAAVTTVNNSVRKLSPLPEVPQPKLKSRSRSKGRKSSTRSPSRTPSRSPRRSRSPSRDRSPYRDRSYKERRRSKHRSDKEERRDKYYDREERRERKKKRRERREQREELYYNRNEHHRYRSPTPEPRYKAPTPESRYRTPTPESRYRTPSPESIPTSKESMLESSSDRPKLDLKSKLMNLDAIKSGAIFNVKPKEPSKTESLKNYRHIRDKSRSESNSPPQESSSYTPPHFPSSSRANPSSGLTPPGNPTYRDTSVENTEVQYQTKRKKKRKRRSRTKSPSSDPGTPPLTIAVTAPSTAIIDNASNEKQILQISPKLKVEIKVLSTKSPEPEIRANTKPVNEVDYNQDIENELVATAVINKKTFEQEITPLNDVSNNEDCSGK